MTFALKKAKRQKVKLRVGLFGASGSGKTMSALKLARGLTDSWEKIAVIDTERQSADLYSHLGEYFTLTLPPPFTPERFIFAIQACEDAGMDVIIIDSITHEWNGKGGCLEIHEAMTGNSYTNWAKVTPRHNAFIDRILTSKAHMICCGRVKDDVVLSMNDKGKQAPEKVGLKAITRDGFDYEMTLCFDLDAKHNAKSTKDRTSLFMDQPEILISEETGQKLLEWSNEGEAEVINLEEKQRQTELFLTVGNLCKQHGIDQNLFQAVTDFPGRKGLTADQLERCRIKIMEYLMEHEAEENDSAPWVGKD